MTSQPPSEIDILAKRWTVEVSPDAGKDGEYGACVYDECAIRMWSEQGDDNARDTLLHEVTHAISEQLGLGMSERQVRPFAAVLLQVLRHNRAFAAYLLE